MSRSWIDRGYHAHQICFFATDDVLAYTFFRLGFGMTHFELFRDLANPTGNIPKVDIHYLDREETVYEIEKAHHAYYPNPPLLWIPHDYFDSRRKDAAESKKDRILAGEIEIIAAFVDNRIVAYFELREGTAETELFKHPSNGQIKGAYCYPDYRGRGIGKALLAEAVLWAKTNNLERLYVEGESANIHGGNFWISHFHPAAYSVRRCVDDRVRIDMFSDV
jgi:GNAT superfamily N-acetyltransferase